MAKTKITVRMPGTLFMPGGAFPCEMSCVTTVDMQVIPAPAAEGQVNRGAQGIFYVRTSASEARNN